MAVDPRVFVLLALLLQDSRGSRPAPAQAPASRPLLVFPKDATPLPGWLKQHGLQSKRDAPDRFTVGDGSLHLVSDQDSVLLATEQGFPVELAQWPRLRLRVRIDQLPQNADLRQTKGDDAAFRVYVAFDRGGGLLSPSNTIAYTWTGDVPVDTVIQSAHYKTLQYLSVGMGVTAGKAGPEWVTIERDLAADYRRAFPTDRKPVPALRGVAIKCDSNDTKSKAEAWLSALELLAPAPAKR